MKKSLNIRSVILILFFVLNSLSIFAKVDESLLGEVAINKDFRFAIPPIPGNIDETEISILVTSPTATYIYIYENNNLLIKDSLLQDETKKFSISPQQTQLFEYNQDSIHITKIYQEKSINIIASFSSFLSVFVSIKNGSYSGIFSPIESVNNGTKYIVSSFKANAKYDEDFATSFTAITAKYDNTKVSVALANNENTFIKMSDGKIVNAGEKTKFTIFTDDVLYLSTSGANGDLSGSLISTSKPVSVISGNYCNQKQESNCDFTIETEIPIRNWGTNYLIPNIADRDENYLLRIFAEKPNTNVYKNGEKIGVLDSGFIELSVKDNFNNPLVISTDSGHQINVVQYTNSIAENPTDCRPFQMNISHIEQFKPNVVIVTPDLHETNSYDSQFVNIIFGESAKNNSDSIEIGEVLNEQINWFDIKKYDINSTESSFNYENPAGVFWKNITIKLAKNGTYKIRSKNIKAKLFSYSYGFNKNSSYAMACSFEMKDFEMTDTLAPSLEFVKHCNGSVYEGRVIDEPRDDADIRANLGIIYLNTSNSYNYEFSYDDFVIGMDNKTNWYLNISDNLREAKANLIFMDRAGNATDTTLYYYPMNAEIKTEDNSTQLNFGNFILGESPEMMVKTLYLSNPKYSIIPEIYQVYLVQKSKLNNIDTHFEVLDLVGLDMTPMLPNEKHSFRVKFNAVDTGYFVDDLGVMILNENQDTCVLKYFVKIEAKVYKPVSVTQQYDNNLTKFYPNPVENRISIESIKNLNGAFIKINDILGKTNFKYEIDQDLNHFDIGLHSLSSGIYQLQIIYSDGTLEIRKFLKN